MKVKLSPTEKQIQSTICEWLDLMKIPYSVTDASFSIGRDGKPRRKVASGWPDVTACLPGGRMWAIECKSITGSLRDSQRYVLDALAMQGALVTIARSLDDVIRDYSFRLRGINELYRR